MTQLKKLLSLSMALFFFNLRLDQIKGKKKSSFFASLHFTMTEPNLQQHRRNVNEEEDIVRFTGIR